MRAKRQKIIEFENVVMPVKVCCLYKIFWSNFLLRFATARSYSKFARALQKRAFLHVNWYSIPATSFQTSAYYFHFCKRHVWIHQPNRRPKKKPAKKNPKQPNKKPQNTNQQNPKQLKQKFKNGFTVIKSDSGQKIILKYFYSFGVNELLGVSLQSQIHRII